MTEEEKRRKNLKKKKYDVTDIVKKTTSRQKDIKTARAWQKKDEDEQKKIPWYKNIGGKKFNRYSGGEGSEAAVSFDKANQKKWEINRMADKVLMKKLKLRRGYPLKKKKKLEKLGFDTEY